MRGLGVASQVLLVQYALSATGGGVVYSCIIHMAAESSHFTAEQYRIIDDIVLTSVCTL